MHLSPSFGRNTADLLAWKRNKKEELLDSRIELPSLYETVLERIEPENLQKSEQKESCFLKTYVAKQSLHQLENLNTPGQKYPSDTANSQYLLRAGAVEHQQQSGFWLGRISLVPLKFIVVTVCDLSADNTIKTRSVIPFSSHKD